MTLNPPRCHAAQSYGGQTPVMTKLIGANTTRRAVLGVFAATAVSAAPVYSKTFGFLKGAGDIRKLSMYSGRTGESLEMIYWIDGEYIPEALAEINHFMRDWREDRSIRMDPRNFDTLAATHRLLNTTEPYLLLSGYRTARTNAMLRRIRGRGVAKKSLHIQGKAADTRLKSRSVTQVARAALACRAGGVGKYSRSNFVHMDCGPIRTWGR